MFFYVYKTENIESGEYYIGKRKSNKSPEKDTYMGSGKWIREMESIYGNLYNHPNFIKTVLELCVTEEDSYKKEIEWLKGSFRDDVLNRNLNGGGGGVIRKNEIDPIIDLGFDNDNLKKLLIKKCYQLNFNFSLVETSDINTNRFKYVTNSKDAHGNVIFFDMVIDDGCVVKDYVILVVKDFKQPRNFALTGDVYISKNYSLKNDEKIGSMYEIHGEDFLMDYTMKKVNKLYNR